MCASRSKHAQPAPKINNRISLIAQWPVSRPAHTLSTPAGEESSDCPPKRMRRSHAGYGGGGRVVGWMGGNGAGPLCLSAGTRLGGKRCCCGGAGALAYASRGVDRAEASTVEGDIGSVLSGGVPAGTLGAADWYGAIEARAGHGPGSTCGGRGGCDTAGVGMAWTVRARLRVRWRRTISTATAAPITSSMMIIRRATELPDSPSSAPAVSMPCPEAMLTMGM